jgi:hypothetical protein
MLFFFLSSCGYQSAKFQYLGSNNLKVSTESDEYTFNEGDTINIPFVLNSKTSKTITLNYTLTEKKNNSSAKPQTFSEKTLALFAQVIAIFESQTGVIVIPQGSDFGIIKFNSNKNDTYNQDKVFELVVDGEELASKYTIIVNMKDSDGPPYLSLKQTYVQKGGTAQMTVSLSHKSAFPIELIVDPNAVTSTALANTDYIPLDTYNLTIPENVTSYSFNVRTKSTSTGNKELNLKVTTPYSNFAILGYNSTANVKLVILDTDITNKISLSDVTVRENESQAKIMIELSEPAATDIYFDIDSFDISAQDESDYLGIHQRDLKIEQGQLYTSVYIPVLDDSVNENNESFRVQLSKIRGATLNWNMKESIVTVLDKGSTSQTPVSSNPTPTLTSSLPSPISAAQVGIQLKFNKNITGTINESSFSVNNGTLSNITGSGSSYTATLTPINSGLVEITFLADKVSDVSGLKNIASNTLSLYFNFKLWATLTTTTATNFNQGPMIVNLSFSKRIVGLDYSDVQLQNATLSELDGTGTQYTLTIYPADLLPGEASKTVTVKIPKDAVYDEDGIGNLESNILVKTYDTQRPTITITSNKTNLTAGESALITFTLSELATSASGVQNGFSESNIKTSSGNLVPSSPFCDKQVCTATLTPLSDSDYAAINISVHADNYLFKDKAGNSAILPSAFQIYSDTKAPTVYIKAKTKSSVLKGEYSDITFTLSDSLAGSSIPFTLANVAATNGTLSSANANFCTGVTCIARFTPTDNLDGSNEAIISLTGTFKDLGGNNGVFNKSFDAPFGTSLTSTKVTFDTKKPNVLLTHNVPLVSQTAMLKKGAQVLVTYTLSETASAIAGVVNGFSTANISSSNGLLTPSPVFCILKTCSATFVPYDDFEGTATLTVSNSSLLKNYYDVAGNKGTYGPNADLNSYSTNIIVDTKAPGLMISSLSSSSVTKNQTIDITFTIPESLTGTSDDFTLGDLSVTNGALSLVNANFCSVANNSTTCMARFTPLDNLDGPVQGVITFVGSFKDAAGNSGFIKDNTNTIGTLGSLANITIDTTAPAVQSITASANTLKIGSSPVIITVTLSENMTNTTNEFKAANISLTGSGSITPSSPFCNGKVCTATYNPPANTDGGSATITTSGLYTDATGNGGAHSYTNQVIQFDTKAPTVTILEPKTGSLSVTSVSPLDFIATFSEPLLNFNNSNANFANYFTITNASTNPTIQPLTSGCAAGKECYKISLVPTASGIPALNVSLKINANALTDLAGNFMSTASAISTTSYDKTPASFQSMTSSLSSLNATNKTSTITLNFTKAVASAPGISLSATNNAGTFSAISCNGTTTCTSTFTGNTISDVSTSITASVSASGYTDLSGNVSTINNSSAITIAHVDTTAPTLSISAGTTTLNTTTTSTTVTFTFSEPIPAANFTITKTGTNNGTLGTISATGDTKVFTATYTYAAGYDSTASFSATFNDAVLNSGTIASNITINNNGTSFPVATGGSMTDNPSGCSSAASSVSPCYMTHKFTTSVVQGSETQQNFIITNPGVNNSSPTNSKMTIIAIGGGGGGTEGRDNTGGDGGAGGGTAYKTFTPINNPSYLTSTYPYKVQVGGKGAYGHPTTQWASAGGDSYVNDPQGSPIVTAYGGQSGGGSGSGCSGSEMCWMGGSGGWAGTGDNYDPPTGSYATAGTGSSYYSGLNIASFPWTPNGLAEAITQPGAGGGGGAGRGSYCGTSSTSQCASTWGTGGTAGSGGAGTGGNYSGSGASGGSYGHGGGGGGSYCNGAGTTCYPKQGGSGGVGVVYIVYRVR